MKKHLVIHPILFGLFPALFLFSHNIDQFSLRILFVPLGIIVAACSVVVAALSLIFRSFQKGGILASCVVLPFLSYGHFVGWAGGVSKQPVIDPVFAFYGLWGLLLVGCTIALIRTKKDLGAPTRILNVIAAALVVMPLANITYHEIMDWALWRRQAVTVSGAGKANMAAITERPDIYYIILDGYGRADALKKFHNYDNTPFIDYLESRDFFVASESRTNFVQTLQSLASSLNYTYLHDIGNQMYVEARGRDILIKLMANNNTTRYLKTLGYQYIAFETGFYNDDMREHADVYLTAGKSLNLYEIALINSTALVTIAPLKQALKPSSVYDASRKSLQARARNPSEQGVPGEKAKPPEPGRDPYPQHRKRVLFTFDELVRTAALHSPKFIFAHIISPHPPFIFDANGDAIRPNRPFSFRDATHFLEVGGTREEYVANYGDQLSYINKKLMETIDGILAASTDPPIIVLQGDHGSRIFVDWKDPQKTVFEESFSILNAYYLPHGGDEKLYEGITPVNTFRLIFDYYLGGSFGLLEDENYFSLWATPYEFLDVTDEVDSEQTPVGTPPEKSLEPPPKR